MYSLFRRSTLIKKGFQSTEIKHEIILNSYDELEEKPSLLEGDHEDMSNKLYSFHNGMVYLKQVDCPSRRHAVAPDGEIPNSVVRRRKIVKEVIEEKPKDKLMSGVWRIDRPIDIDAAMLGESLVSVIDPNMIAESLEEIKAMSEELARAERDKLDEKEMFPNLAVPGWQATKLYKICKRLFMEPTFKLAPDADWNAVFDRLITMLESKEFPVFSTAAKYLIELNNCHATSEDYRKEVAIKLYGRLKAKEDPNIKIAALKTIGAMDLRREQDYGLIKENVDSDDIDVSTAALELKRLFKIPDDIKVEPKPTAEVKRKPPRKLLSGEAGRLQRMAKGIDSRMQRTTTKDKIKYEADQKPVETTKVDSAKLKTEEDMEMTKGIQKPVKREVKSATEKGKRRKIAEKEEKEQIEATEKEERERRRKKRLSTIDEEISTKEELQRLILEEMEYLRQKAMHEELTEEEKARLAELEAKSLEIEAALKLKKEERDRIIAQILAAQLASLTDVEAESLSKEEVEELMRRAAEITTVKDKEEFLAMMAEKQFLTEKKKYENLSAEEMERLAYLEEVQSSAISDDWKQALASKQFADGMDNIYGSESVTFHHPTDMLRKSVMRSKHIVPVKMYKVHKRMKNQGLQRGDTIPKEIVRVGANREEARPPSIPNYESKRVPGFLISDAFKKPDKSREKFFKRTIHSLRSAPTPTQRLVAHLDEPSNRMHR